MRLWKILVVLIVLAVAALAGYAYLGDMQPQQSETRLPVELDLNSGQPAETPAESTPADAAPAAPAATDAATAEPAAPAESE